MRLFVVPIAVVLMASPAIAAEGPAAPPPPPAAPPPPTDQAAPNPPGPPMPHGVLLPRGPSEVLAGEGLGRPLRGPMTGRFPQRRWHDEMPNPLAARDSKPLAGYQGGTFFIRDRFDNFRFYPGVALHLDSLNYFGKGVSDTELKSTIQVRRLRLSLGGEILNTWQFLVQPEFGSTTFDNIDGKNERYAASAGQTPSASSGVYAPVQAGSYKSSLADAYLNYGPTGLINVQVGQFLAPFTMDNRTSSYTTTFLETSLPSRALGNQAAREIGAMAWGTLRKNIFYYSAGVFLGDGANRPNADNRADVIMRYYVRPLAYSAGPLKEAQIGFSFKYGMRDKNRVAYDYNPMTTQSGYSFWRTTYTNSGGRLVHVIPSGAQTGAAAELRIPYDRFDLRGEFVFVRNNTREGIDGYQVTNTERLGRLDGWSYYVQLGYWLWGKPFLTGAPGESSPRRVDFNKPDPGVSPQGMEVAIKWEQLRVNYDGAKRDGVVDAAKNIDGDIKVNAFTVGANYWATRHLRLSVDYVYYHFPDSKAGGNADQRALAPGNRLDAKNPDFADAATSAHSMHEVSARMGFNF